MAKDQQFTYQTDEAHIISVKEARKIMGIAANGYKDEEVKKLVEQMLVLARISGKTAYEQIFKEGVPKSL
ncbi:MAG TPA: hypothetical protein PK543_00060 [Candidatus Saccharibacteria bacterium]|nr:hypothetical protein [Candidatus Saccharibacteria bacterium]